MADVPRGSQTCTQEKNVGDPVSLPHKCFNNRLSNKQTNMLQFPNRTPKCPMAVQGPYIFLGKYSDT